jgi:phosphoenolpyruvate carboxylase
MSTQHPDNVSTPFFSSNSIIEGDAEVKEAYYAYSHLGCDEQMWDSEGKDVDNFVVRKLLASYPQFFQEKRLGKDVFLTLRVPNPDVEKSDGKILLETLESIPRTYDSAKTFYGPALNDGSAPVFEVILPMTTNAVQVNRVWSYYKNFVAGKARSSLSQGDISVAEWVGEFRPENISVIPLIENQESMENIEGIVGGFLQGKKLERLRVFLARSDPALNYGSLSAVLLVKNALQKLHALEEKTSTELLPIIGTGSAPFRGNLTPMNAKHFLTEYPSIQTFTIQSAFKYDYPVDQVRSSLDFMRASSRGKPAQVDEAKSLELVARISEEYAKQVRLLAPMINKLSSFVPSRRKRHLHIGLFGYSRSLTGISLPRAITFCASLYSMGIPPELLGLSALTSKDLEYLDTAYPSFRQDTADAAQFLDKKNLEKFPALQKEIEKAASLFDFQPNAEHNKSSSLILKEFERENGAKVKEEIEKAAWTRRFLG